MLHDSTTPDQTLPHAPTCSTYRTVNILFPLTYTILFVWCVIDLPDWIDWTCQNTGIMDDDPDKDHWLTNDPRLADLCDKDSIHKDNVANFTAVCDPHTVHTNQHPTFSSAMKEACWYQKHQMETFLKLAGYMCLIMLLVRAHFKYYSNYTHHQNIACHPSVFAKAAQQTITTCCTQLKHRLFSAAPLQMDDKRYIELEPIPSGQKPDAQSL